MRFRYGGHEFKRSLRTKHRRVANGSLGQVEETLRLLELGMAEVPVDGLVYPEHDEKPPFMTIAEVKRVL